MAYLFPLAGLFTAVLLSSFVWLTTAKCGGKTVLKALQGTIDDGPNNYPKNQQCEWLIEAPQQNMTITLEFIEYGTECTYDYLFVYDGPSYMSKLLGSFSGNNVPDTVVASSGKMLIHLYSDTNYVMEGFKANYTIENCSQQCSGHGTCSNSQCICNMQQRGKYCELSLCPKNCNVQSAHGNCDTVNKHCTCNPGFAGESCSLSLHTNEGSNTWYKMVTYSSVFTSRMGHAAVYHHKTDTIWSFGGFDLNSADNNLLKFNMTTGQWIKVLTAQPHPTGRYSHTASLYNDEIFIFGGQINDKQLTNELWKFNLNTLTWTLLNGSNAPPPVAMHTANVVDDKLYIYGGRTTNESFTSAMYKYDLSSANTGWTKVMWKSGKQYTYRIMGHSTVYLNDTRSLVVFGGYSLASARNSIRMNKLYIFHVDLLVWSEWLIQGNVPKPRSFHSSSVVGDYIVLFGGTVHEHNKDETCYDNELHFFHLKCRKWVPMSALTLLSPGSSANKPKIGRFSHVALVRDSTLLIFGGYYGAPLGDMLGYKLPTSVAMVNVASNIPGVYCGNYKTGKTCKADPNCGWCKTVCYPVQNASKCTSSDWETSSCPGACGVHGTCTACLTWGSRHVPYCGWCVQDSHCYPLSSPQGGCEKPNSQNAEKIRGWWGTQGQFLSGDVVNCRKDDYPPGLVETTTISPEHPQYPDDVKHVHTTEETKIPYDFRIVGKTKKKTAVGYVYPFKYAATPYVEAYKFYLYLSMQAGAKSTLYVNKDNKVGNCNGQETSASASCTIQGTFLSPLKDASYYIKHVGERKMDSNFQQELTFVTKWNKISNMFTALNGPFLKPYSSDGNECTNKESCLACMTDASCGWCELTNQCVSRKSASVCTNGSDSQHLVLNATECTRCDDNKDCTTCTQQKLCEWINHQFLYLCARKGTHSGLPIIKEPASCHSECERRNTCSACLANSIGCAWCDKTESCFVFGSYITRYPYGECTRWVDVNSGGKCKNCSTHTTCKTCLADVQCGWCGSTDNPLRGSCVGGDFSGPRAGQCSSLVNLNESVAWSYVQCPDIDECRLDLHNCHYNATCHNIYDSYNCVCNRGYTGDGKTACNKTCDPPCVHGLCKPDYTCLCDLGWKGLNCSIDCGCNGHSTCNQAIGTCDKCQDYTHGNHCQLCVPGSYGNATTKQGCKKCDCNGHGDVTKGECDIKTGVCFCKDNTMGDRCDQCLPGLLGNPGNGSRCYYECTAHNILTNVTQGDISTEIGSGVVDRSQASCLWVISASTNSSHNIIYNKNPPQSSSTSITLQFISMNLSCSTEHLDVYDGLPYFLLNIQTPHPPSFYKLGSFCGTMETIPKYTTSVTGNMVVVFHGNITQGSASAGFGAIFKVNRCADSCHGNRYCVVMSSGESCVCKDGWFGPDCNMKTCPNNCSSGSGHGVCNMKTSQCQCTPGFTGSDCSKVIPPGKGFWKMFFTSSLPNSSYSEIPRVGHSMVVHSNSLWIYGGYSMPYGILNSIYRYDVISRSMSHVTSNQLPSSVPKGRYLHCAVVHKDSMFVYGGLTKDGVSNDMWYFDVNSAKWNQVTFSPDASNPSVASHTCTLVDDTITIVGGYDPTTGFNSKIYQYNIPAKTWSTMDPLETGTNPTGLYGHTTVYHPTTQSLFVFGGYQFKDREVKPSSDLYTLHLQSRQWKLLQPIPPNKPLPKFFHTAAMVGDVMVIYGGRTSTSEQGSSDLLAYKVNCNYWHTLNKQDSAVLGSSPGLTVSAASSSNDSMIYIFGGLNGLAKSALHKLTLPTDLCQGMRDKNICTLTPGCSWCEVHYSNSSINQSFIQATSCYSVTSSLPAACHATSNVTQTVFVNGSECNAALAVQQRSCDSYSSCSACLSSYPNLLSGQLKCHWCVQCSGGGKCIEKVKECENTDSCGITPAKRTSPGTCPENVCEASTCKDCITASKCMWTSQLKWLSDTKLEASSSGVVFPWNCFDKTAKDKYPINIIVMKEDQCPKNCMRHKDCRSCLGDTGGDGGWKKCVWSESLGQCYSPSYLPMVELAGVGGRIVRGTSDHCMAPCVLQKQCSTCFQSYNCGWCSKLDSNGQGVCMEGGLKGPLHGICYGKIIDSGPRTPANLSKKIATPESPIWASVLCPLENECTNGRQNCSNIEDCIDTAESFKCVCKPGYKREGYTCKPICIGGCGNGVCVTPNNCSCNFGWTSRNCSIKCHCNNHGHCLSESELDTCYDCRNHTKGKTCELCSPLFVGNATNNGTCRSCYEVCNKSAYVCMSLDDRLQAQNNSLSFEYKEVAKWLDHGPTDINKDLECLCRNNSKGVKCQHCVKGYFFLKSYCIPCQCNGHGDDCQDANGQCSCHNNTESDCAQANGPCYSRQCIKCASGFLGRPWLNRQCYSKVNHLNEYIISSKAGSVNGEKKAPPLPKGTTVSYVIYPRFTNVDIRTTIDVFQGALDVYVSTFDRTFAVYVNKTTGVHSVEVSQEKRARRASEVDLVMPQSDVIRVNAGKDKLNTFVTLHSTSDVIHVTAVENRLVLTFPYSNHYLRSSRFYMMLMGVGDDTHDDTTGIIYFRQDLSQIDLFVFFSVFFSVFFLVLALCIIVWKMKQFHDRRRIAQVQEREMETMASRPYATYSFLTDMKTAPQSCWKIKRENSRRNLRDRKGLLYMREASHRPVISPVAQQTTEDAKAAILSVMLQLPRNENSDFQLSFGSVAVTNSNQHSIGSLFGYPILSGSKARNTVSITS